MEMVIGIEADTRVHLGGIMADFATKAAKLADMLRYLVTHIGLYINDDSKKVSFKSAFGPRLVRCTRDITEIWLPGVGRRPLWNSYHDAEKLIAANLHIASNSAVQPGAKPVSKIAWRHLGVDITIKVPKGMSPVRWTPPALLVLRASLHAVVAARTGLTAT